VSREALAATEGRRHIGALGEGRMCAAGCSVSGKASSDLARGKGEAPFTRAI